MKREDVKNKIPGITDEQLDWLMQENGADITREKSAANALQAQVDSLTAQVATAQDGLKAFGAHKPEDFAAAQQQIAQLQQQMQAQADGFAFDHALDTAILGKQGRSVKAVRALLDVDALKGSKDPHRRHCPGAGSGRQGEPLGLWRGAACRLPGRERRRRRWKNFHRLGPRTVCGLGRTGTQITTNTTKKEHPYGN